MKSLKIRTKMALLLLIVVITVGSVSGYSISQMNKQKIVSLQTLETQIRTNYDQNIKEQVENACSLLQTVYDKASAGDYTMQEAKKIGADLLRELRFGDDGYFWADTYNGQNIVLLGSPTEGTNRMDAKDSSGFPLIKEIISAGRQADGGYTDYVFPKSGETEPSPKRSYSRTFEPFKWVVGTGNYTDYIDDYIASQRNVIEENISNSINKLIIVTITCFTFAIALGLYIVWSIVVPLSKLNKITNELAKGNLNTEININSKDEVGQLASSMGLLVGRLQTYIVYIKEISGLLTEIGNGNLVLSFKQKYDGDFAIVKDALVTASDMLNNTLSKINIGADQVASGSEQVSAGAQALSQGATEQASSIQELSATINEIAENINRNAQNAMKAR